MTLEDMVREGSMSDDGRELLRGIAAAARSFLAYALPQNAGKSTLVHAMLAEVPSDLPQRTFFGTTEETSALAAIDPRGYLVVNEIGHRGKPGYLAQDEVRRLFQLVEQGYLVASSLHADSVEEVVRVLRDNGASEHACSEVSFLIKIRALGPRTTRGRAGSSRQSTRSRPAHRRDLRTSSSTDGIHNATSSRRWRSRVFWHDDETTPPHLA